MIGPEDEEEFRVALEVYRDQSGRMFPTWSEILEVLRSVGYEKRVWKPVGAGFDISDRETTERG